MEEGVHASERGSGLWFGVLAWVVEMKVLMMGWEWGELGIWVSKSVFGPWVGVWGLGLGLGLSQCGSLNLGQDSGIK